MSFIFSAEEKQSSRIRMRISADVEARHMRMYNYILLYI